MEAERIDLRGVNAYLVGGETLVDAGWTWSASSVKEAVENAGDGLEDVERVLVTHYDLDHVGGLSCLARAGLDAPVYIAEPDGSYLTDDAKPPIRNRKGAFQRVVGLGIRKPPFPIEKVEDGDIIAGYEVVATPGHTPGHVAYFRGDAAFVGDAVRENGGGLEPMPSFMSYDVETAKESIDSLAARFDGETAYVGHGEPVDEAGAALGSQG